VRPFGISLDAPWSHRAWAEALGVASVPLLSDARAEAAAAFGVLGESHGVPRAARSAFLVADSVVVASWLLTGELPDIDAIVAAAATAGSRALH
jgi:peroxiredoxin